MLVLTFTILPFGVLVLLLADRWRHPRGRERAPRCMGSIVFEKNERHAAWERSWPAAGATPAAQNERHAAWESLFFKKTSATLHGSAPGRPQAPPNVPEAIPAQHGNHFFSKKRTPRCMGALLPLKGAQDHPRQKNDVFASKMLIFHWKNVGLEPTGA